MINVLQLTKYYDNKCVIYERMDRYADTGFYLLLGESGSGKTTYLNILYGLISFDAGRIIYDDREYVGQTTLSEISYIAEYITQDPFYVDFLTIGDNLKMVSDDEELIGFYSERFHLTDLLGQYPEFLSGGERQRFAIVRAILQKKKILFLDEPTAALDETNKREVFALLKELKDECLILCASHDQVAQEYADYTVHFTKNNTVMDEIDLASDDQNHILISRQSVISLKTDSQEKSSLPWLLKWFRSTGKKLHERLLLIMLLTIAFCLAMFADFPERKLDITKDKMYHLNVLSVHLNNFRHWKELGLPEESVCAVVLDYAMTCPDGNENVYNAMRILPEYELQNVLTLPDNDKLFPLSDRIEYGTYFTDANQILLTHEMAKLLYPSDPDSLIGKKLKKTFYGLGDVDLTIIGILGELTESEKACMDQYTTNRDAYYEYYFISSKLTERLENDDSFFYITQVNGRRVYNLYFNSYQDLKQYYKQYQPSVGSGKDYIFQLGSGITEVELRNQLVLIFPVLLPLAILLAVISLLFYIQTRRIEYIHRHQFISVFEYAGYDKRKVTSDFILLNVLELALCCLTASGIAFLITSMVNLVNQIYCIVPLVIFTYNPAIIFSLIPGVILFGAISTWILYKKVTVLSWYEDLIDTRDLL